MSQSYLSHHGILGQKWGIRRGKNYPLSNSERSAEQRRRNPESASSKRMKKMSNMSDDELRKSNERKNLERQYIQNNPVKSDAFNRETVRSVVSDSDTVIRGLSKLIPRKNQEDLSKYSDAELQKIVNRQRLEQQYNQLNPDKIDTGAEYLREGLQTAGALAGLYLTYKTIKKMV